MGQRYARPTGAKKPIASAAYGHQSCEYTTINDAYIKQLYAYIATVFVCFTKVS